jgi:PEGA domain-containing protein
MYHPPPKRRQLIKLVATYILMSITVVGLVIVLVLIMLGYQFNRSDGKIEQGGLMQFDTSPTGANVTIDGKSFGSRTPSKTTAASGQHYVTMQRNGYRPWQKSVELTAGGILWLNYTRLIPNDVTPTNVANFPVLSQMLPSPDNKWLAMKENAATPTVTLTNITGDDIKTATLTLPQESYTAPSEGQAQSFKFDTWDKDSRYILASHTYDGAKQEWLVIDTTNIANTKNITKLLGITATKAVFSENDNRTLYVQIGSEVHRVNLSDNSLSAVLLSNVAEFESYDQRLGYVTLPDPTTRQRSVGYLSEGASKPRTIKSFSDDGLIPLHFAISKYFSDTYVSIAHGEQIEILMGDLPRSDATQASSLVAAATMTIPGGVQYLSVQTEGRFITAQQGVSYMVYDLELKKVTTTALRGKAPVTSELRWLDGYTLWSDQDGRLRLYEFDGANQQDIMQVEPGFSTSMSQNDKYIYGVTKSDDGQYHLTRVRLILP